MLVKNNNRLKELRVNRGYTLDDIESKTGIKRGTYSNYENHNTEPKLETWQKLADFFGVSVSYLQGIEPDFSVITSKTKKVLFSLLSEFYFADSYDDSLKNGASKRLKSAINEYSKYADFVPSIDEIKLKNSEQKNKYFEKYFSFLLNDTRTVEKVNRYSYQSNSKAGRLIYALSSKIQAHTLQEFQTALGLSIEKSIGSELLNRFTAFERNLLFCKDSKSMRNQFDEYIHYLNKTRDMLNNSLEKVDVNELSNELSNRRIYLAISNLVQNDDDLYNKLSKMESRELFEWVPIVKEYLVQKNKPVPKEINEYLEQYKNKK